MLVTHIRSIAMIGSVPRVIITLSITTICRDLRVILGSDRIYSTSILFHFRSKDAGSDPLISLYSTRIDRTSRAVRPFWIRSKARSWSKPVGFHRQFFTRFAVPSYDCNVSSTSSVSLNRRLRDTERIIVWPDPDRPVFL